MKTLGYIICLLLMLPTSSPAQDKPRADSVQRLSVMSYNVENLFDLEDDPTTQDTEFTPEGDKAWTAQRYSRKLHNIARVIARASEDSWPLLVGLVEVENDLCLEELLHRTALSERGYAYCITHSADPRGIDVALLYRKDLLRNVRHSEYEVAFADDPERKSRNILLVSGELPSGETLHTLVLHLPSMRGGRRATKPLRAQVARRAREICDSLYHEAGEHKPHFILLGDMNSKPRSAEIREALGAGEFPALPLVSTSRQALELYNLFTGSGYRGMLGSHYFRGVWSQLDQIIISRSLLESGTSLRYVAGSARTYRGDFLLEAAALGRAKPRRTYAGPYYKGGYSDHLPVLAEFELDLQPNAPQ